MQLRNTRQKEAIRGAFVKANRPLSPEETLTLAQEQVSGISIATIYRNIGALVEENWLVPIALPGDTARYEVAGKEHHHHFHCNACGKVFEMKGCAVKLSTKAPRGFRVTGHEFFLYGVCATCN